jgi:hypothetical protein
MKGDEDTHEIGRMVAGLQATVTAFQTNWGEQDRRAAEGRKALYERFEGVGRDVAALTHQVTSVVKDVAEMKPAVADWMASKARAEGASWAIKVMWVVGGATAVGVGWGIDHFLVK